MTPSQNETQALIALVTNEWQPLPLNEISAITGKAPSRCGIVLRTYLGLQTAVSGSRHPDHGATYIEDAHGYRFARCYHRTVGESTRYWWRRFPATTSDAEILSSAKALTKRAKLIEPAQAPVQTVFPMPVIVPVPSEWKSTSGLAAEVAKAAAEAEKAAQNLERLINIRDARISQLEAELSALRAL